MEVLKLAQRVKLVFLTCEQICSQGETSCFALANFNIESYTLRMQVIKWNGTSEITVPAADIEQSRFY